MLLADKRREWVTDRFGVIDTGPGWRVWARGAWRAYQGCRRLKMSRRTALVWVWNARPLRGAQ